MSVFRNLFFSFRRLFKREPGFAVLSAAVIAVGVAISLAIFSLTYNVAFKSISFRPNQDLVIVTRLDKQTHREFVADDLDGYTYQSLKASAKSFEALGAVKIFHNVILNDNKSVQLYAAAIEPSLLALTHTAPILGRALDGSDDEPGAQPVVLLSYRIWQDYYGGQKDIVGQRTRVNGVMRTVIGVMPQSFGFPLDSAMWIPLQLPNLIPPRGHPGLTLVGVLKSDVPISQASAEVASIAARWRTEHPHAYSDMSARVRPYIRMGINGAFGAALVISGASVIIILLVCLNVGTLLTARTAGRVQELAIRGALGASYGQIVQCLLSESFLICLAGGLGGIFLAHFAIQVIVGYIHLIVPPQFGGMPFWYKFGMDWHAALYAVLIIGFIWVLSGSVPAFRSHRLNIAEVSRDGSKGSVGSGKGLAKWLLGLEIAFSCCLLALGGAFVAAVALAHNISYGAATRGYLTADVRLPNARYPKASDRQRYASDLERELDSQPGVSAVSYTTALPGSRSRSLPFNLEDHDLRTGSGAYPRQMVVWVSANYFSAMGVRLLQGRPFSDFDTDKSRPAAIIDQLLARKLWPRGSPIGKRLQIEPETKGPWLTVVGVNSHIIQAAPESGGARLPTIYRPLSQSTPSRFAVLLRVAGDPNQYRAVLTAAAARVDPDVPLYNVKPLSKSIAERTASYRLFSAVFKVLGLLAALLTVSGIYGMVAHSAVQRSTEIGIRRALGATDKAVVRLFLKEGGYFLAAGLVAGGTAALLTSRAFAQFVPQVSELVPWSLLATAVLLSICVSLASFVPIAKLISTSPSAALSRE